MVVTSFVHLQKEIIFQNLVGLTQKLGLPHPFEIQRHVYGVQCSILNFLLKYQRVLLTRIFRKSKFYS